MHKPNYGYICGDCNYKIIPKNYIPIIDCPKCDSRYWYTFSRIDIDALWRNMIKKLKYL